LRCLTSQCALWKRFENKTVHEFLHSLEAHAWHRGAQKTKNAKPLFELDQMYKSTKRTALNYELKIRAVIRANPLLTYSDLKRLGVKNAQLIWERFPQRELHRARAWRKFRRSLMSSNESKIALGR